MLDYTVNGRPLRRPGLPDANRSQFPPMAPHGIYRASGEDCWVAIACRGESDWLALESVVNEPWCQETRFAHIDGRLRHQDGLDSLLETWTSERDRFAVASVLQAAGVPASAVQMPSDRIENDPNTEAWGLWPEVLQTAMGRVRVDGLPVHLSETDWRIERGAPSLGEHNTRVFGDLLGLSAGELASLRESGVI